MVLDLLIVLYEQLFYYIIARGVDVFTKLPQISNNKARNFPSDWSANLAQIV